MKSLYESIFDTDFEPTVDNTKTKPRSKKELQQIIAEHIKQIKPRPGQEVDLNWIDISDVDDLGELFEDTNYIPVIDTWKIDHVKDFSYMFAHNEHIVCSPLPVLQKKLLDTECYNSMFWDCSSLKEPPVLPATDLTRGCYRHMFADCTALTEPPILPAKKPARACYWSMFQDCISLVKPPALPAKKLESHCYRNMFENCSSLVYAPKLPATELAESCYETMFQNCNNLRIKAKIPAGVNLDRFTARDMYNGCPCENK